MNQILTMIAFSIFLMSSLTLHAQMRQSDLEDIERHRKPQRTVPVLQSLDDPTDSSSATASLIGTWDFLDEADRQEDAEINDDSHIDIETLEGRLATLPQELTVPGNEILELQISNYVIRHAKSLKGILGKYDYYAPSMRAAFARHGLPEDLSALAIVESAMNPLALSPVGARGMWQFMPETAIRYGLRCDYAVDERLDPWRSADAAARYLKTAYARFGNWALAISSYNCGIQAVESAIAKAGTDSFWDIYPFLPAETRGYMPAYVAALYTIAYHDLHGITPRKYTEGPVTNFKITRNMTFREIIRATGITQKELSDLNPQYQAGMIPGEKKGYILRIPRKYAKLFKDNINTVDAG